MMSWKHSFLSIAMLLASVAAQAGAHVTFKKTSHNFGTINRNQGNVEAVFEFVNDGDEPLVFLSASTTCSCTKVDYPRAPIMPKKRGSVRVTYEPKSRATGVFSRVVQLYTNAPEGRNLITIAGNSVD